MKPSRKTHKNRFSITHLSSETTATLPEYVPACTTTTTWQQPPRHSLSQQGTGRDGIIQMEVPPWDQPPEYPDSADEADEETDSVSGDTSYDGDTQVPGRPLLLPPHPSGATATAFIPASPSLRHRGKRISLSTSPSNDYTSGYHHQHYQHHTHPHRHRQSNHINRPHLYHRKFRSTVTLPYPSPTDDPYLDSLLERSVHALEMSNTLLQSSISTRTSLSALLKTPISESGESKWVVDDDGEMGMDKFEERAKGLTKRINVHEDRREQWVDDLDKIRRDVERLFGDEEEVNDRWEGSSTGRGRSDDGRGSGVSSSVPASSSMPTKHTYKRRPSQLDLQETSDQTARLTYSPQYHSRLVSPVPRALTQYIAAQSADSESLTLPSALGTRVYTAGSQSTISLHSTPVMPQVTDKHPEPTTAAYNMLASFVNRTPGGTSSMPGSLTSPSVFGSLFPKLRRRASSTEKDRPKLIEDPRPSHGRALRSPLTDLIHRPMTPPAEVSTGSSSSSESLIAKQTVLSLRKILDEQPARSTLSLDQHANPRKKLKAPVFMPVTPSPAPQASTSHATASVSRLFTKAIHTSSTRPPEPPKQSALKHGAGSRTSISPTQQIQLSASSESTASSTADFNWTRSGLMKAQLGLLPEILNAGVAKAFGQKMTITLSGSGSNSATSSGQSTPKRISFAELPEVERPQGRSLRFKEKQQARRKRRRSNGLSIVSGNENWAENELGDTMEASSPPIGGGWWSGWLGGDGGVGGGALAGMGGGNGGMYVSRLEERVGRPWSGVERPGFGFGDWAV